jgi:hypothetical protein
MLHYYSMCHQNMKSGRRSLRWQYKGAFRLRAAVLNHEMRCKSSGRWQGIKQLKS